MNTRYSWTNTVKSQQQQTLMNSFIQSVTFDVANDKEFVTRQLQQMDKRLSRIHAPTYYDPNLINKEVQPYFLGTRKLSLPKNNSLTDSLIRNSLGCDEKYAKSYLQLLQSTKQDQQKQRRVQDIKKRFSQTNSYIDVFANTKPHYNPQLSQKFRPVVDNQHQSYLKTQLIFLQKPKNSKYNQKQYFEKHFDQVTKKIQQLGGMQDTISKMENSLNINQIKNSRKKQVLQNFTNSSPKKSSYLLPQKQNKSTILSEKKWIDRSRMMRETLRNKFQFN